MAVEIEVKSGEKTDQEAESSLEEAISSEKSETSPSGVQAPETETSTEEAETTEPEAKVEAEKIKPDLELEKLLKNPKVASLVDSEVDKRLKTYDYKIKASDILLKEQSAKIKELSLKQTETKLTKAMEAVLAGDEAEGAEPDVLEASRKGYEEIKADVLEYKKNAQEVAEVAELSATLIKTLDKGIVDHFNLNNANPTVKARGITELVSEAIHFIGEKEAMAVFYKETPLLRNGSEVHKHMVSFITDYVELKDQKARDLLVGNHRREFSVSPKQKPPGHSGDSGGEVDKSKLTTIERVALAISKMDKGK